MKRKQKQGVESVTGGDICKLGVFFFTKNKKVCYNLTVKKFLAITISICAFMCALVGGGSVAFAKTNSARDDAEFYPTSFETAPVFAELKDFAVGNDEILYLGKREATDERNSIYKFDAGNTPRYEHKGKDVTSLYFADDEFYYGTGDGCFYALKNLKPIGSEGAPADNPQVDEPKEDNLLDFENYYYFLQENKWYVLDKTQKPDPVAILLNGVENVKRYGDTVYAIKDNMLYSLNGADKTEITVEDFDKAKEIKTGGAYANMTASATGTVNFVNLTDGAYMTEVNLDKLTETSEFYPTGNTVKLSASKTPSALLLYTAGNDAKGLSVVAIKDKTYLIHPKDTSPKTAYPLVESRFTEGTATEGYIHSSPFESNATKVAPLPSGAKLTILKEIRRADNPELDHDFYYVEYAVDETTTKRGFVRFGLLSTFTFNEDPPSATIDPDETYTDAVRTVILILVVLLLLSIAGIYLIYVGTSDKRKNKK